MRQRLDTGESSPISHRGAPAFVPDFGVIAIQQKTEVFVESPRARAVAKRPDGGFSKTICHQPAQHVEARPSANVTAPMPRMHMDGLQLTGAFGNGVRITRWPADDRANKGRSFLGEDWMQIRSRQRSGPVFLEILRGQLVEKGLRHQPHVRGPPRDHMERADRGKVGSGGGAKRHASISVPLPGQEPVPPIPSPSAVVEIPHRPDETRDVVRRESWWPAARH